MVRLEAQHLARGRQIVKRRVRILRVDVGAAHRYRMLDETLEPLEGRIRSERRCGADIEAFECLERADIEREPERAGDVARIDVVPQRAAAGPTSLLNA